MARIEGCGQGRDNFCDLVGLSHRHLAEVLTAGDLAVDLTAGNGHDTLFLWRQVAPQGRVIAFDIQLRALEGSAARLSAAAVPHSLDPTPEPGDFSCAGVHLLAAGHERLGELLAGAPVRALIANLGYLPGGERGLITRTETTLAALEAARALLLPGGRLAVVGYGGHPGGQQEVEAVGEWFAAHSPKEWDVLHLRVSNRRAPPCLWLAEKKGG